MAERKDPSLVDRATALLLAVAEDPTGPAARAYDALCYPVLLRFVRRRGAFARWATSQQTGTGGELPSVPFAEAGEVAHDAVVLALARARAAADRFDPDRGDGLRWAMRQTTYAYREVVADRTGSRRKFKLAPADDATIELATKTTMPDPADGAADADLLARCMAPLNFLEAQAIVLFHTAGLSYEEIAASLLGSASRARQVERLLHGARSKMREAYARENP